MRKAIIILFFLTFLFPNLAFGQSTNYRFTGKELDRVSDLYYYNQRYYEPTIGKFTQPDPLQNYLVTPELQERTGMTLEEVLSNPQRLNSYSYSLNNPINVVDPTGEVAISKERQERFNKVSDYIRNDDSYWLIRDRDGNAAGLDAIWNKSLELSDNNVGDALNTFYDSVNINWRDNKTLDGSREDYLSRLNNLPTALSGEWGGDISNIDKLQHFVASARLSYKYGPRIAGLLGRLKEVKDGFRALFDRRRGGYKNLAKNDDGYSMSDISANLTGIFWLQEYKSGQVNPSDVINNLY